MLKNIDKKYLIYGGVLGGIIILFLIFLLIVSFTKGNKLNYKGIESKLQNSAVKYYEKHEKEIPKTDGSTVSISSSKLIKSGNMTDFSKNLEEGETCKGEVYVTNNNGNYIYLPYLDCGKKYKTKKLSDKIISDGNVNDIDEGLYEIDEEDNNYIFRGENVNNYINFAGKLWRIIRINSDGSIKIIAVERFDQFEWDNRYNIDKKYTSGINDYEISRIKDKLKEIYEDDEIFTKKDRSMIASQDLCVGRRSVENAINDGTVECENIVENQQIGLLQLNEYIIPSLDENCHKASDRSCANYNFLATFDRSFWTLTGDSETSYMVCVVDNFLDLKQAGGIASINPVIVLTKNLVYDSGNGSIDKPYKIKDFQE